MNSYLLTLDQSFCPIPHANMIQNIKELLSPNALLKMFFLLLSGVITLGKEKDLLNPLFLKLIIILIIKKLGIIPFFFQNNRYQHSWFFTFDKIHEIKNLPLWFDEWWKLFGAETSILPSPLCNKLLEYSKNFPSPSPINLFPPELYFFLHFNIPWILSWDYNFVSPNENIYNP
jgi:hypothetical protein